MSETMVAVQYLGPITNRVDNVLRRNVIWLGPGDIQEVPERDAIEYFRYPDVWAKPEEKRPLKTHTGKHGEILMVEQTNGEVETSAVEPKPEPGPEPTADEFTTQLVAVIAGMDAEDQSIWTTSGLPTTDYLSRAMNFQVSADQRDTAWKVIQEAADAE